MAKAYKDNRIKDLGNHNLLVLGNGFDLDLGYLTSYKDFFKNSNDIENGGFPFIKGGGDYGELGAFVLEQAILKSWYDLENILARYGSRNVYILDSKALEADKKDYGNLVRCLRLYLNSLDLSHPNNQSVAVRVLSSFIKCKSSSSIYSFNYTNVSSIAKVLGLSCNNVSYVHGSLENDDIILGVGDYEKLSDPYHYLYKTSSSKYKSTNLIQDLDVCDNLLIFGLSMSRVDYPYFERFFKKVSKGEFDSKKCIRIFTSDENSRMSILRNLRAMNQEMISLMNNSDFDIIRTCDNIDEGKVNDLINMMNSKW